MLGRNRVRTASERTSGFGQETGLFHGLVNPEMGAEDAEFTCVWAIALGNGTSNGAKFECGDFETVDCRT